jgi:hypothetical protein
VRFIVVGDGRPVYGTRGVRTTFSYTSVGRFSTTDYRQDRIAMGWGELFKIANTIALVCWLLLLVLPRFPKLLAMIRYGVISFFAIGYAAIVVLCFSSIEGGGFNSLPEVKILFSSDAAVLAGWIHYLAFDLFVGLWIAEQCDQIRIGRLLQIPLLFFTFMFGPIGLLLFYLLQIVRTGSLGFQRFQPGFLPPNLDQPKQDA